MTTPWLRLAMVLLTGCLTVSLKGQRLPLSNYTEKFPELARGASGLFQDSEGWLWMVNGYEVMRYNGATWTTLKPAAGTQVDYCFQVMQVGGEIWVRSRPYPLVVDGDSLRPHPSIHHEEDMVNVFPATDRSWLLGRNGLAALDKGQPRMVIQEQMGRDLSQHLFPFQDTLLVGSILRGNLVVFDLKHRQIHQVKAMVRDMCMAPDGRLFLVNGHNLQQVTTLVKQPNGWVPETQHLANLPFEEAFQMAADTRGDIWIAVNKQGLFQYTPNKPLRRFEEADGLPGLNLQDLLVDREENLWIGFSNGLLKMASGKAEKFTVADGLPYNMGDQLIPLGNNGTLLFKSSNGAAVWWQGRWQPLEREGGPLRLWQVAAAADTLLMATGKNLFRAVWDDASGRLHHWEDLGSFPHPIVGLGLAAGGTVVCATHLHFYAGGRNGFVRIGGPFADNLRVFYLDSASRVWAGEFGGALHGFQLTKDAAGYALLPLPKAFKQWPADLRAVRRMATDRDGHLLAGTRFNGLFRLVMRGDTVQRCEHLPDVAGHPAQSVWDIAVDQDNRYWLAGEGLARIGSGAEGLEVVDAGRKFGIQRAGAVAITPDGRVWTATPNGVVAFDPDAEQGPGPAVRVAITGIRVNELNNLDTAVRMLRLPFRQNNLMLSFSANSLRNEHLITYSYSMGGGHDTAWSEPTTDHTVRFAALSPGTYDFRVRAWDSDGLRIPGEAALAITIMGPWYASWWFIGMVVLIMAAAAFAFYRFRIRQLRQLMQIRMDIAGNLHDDIGASLTNILMLNEMARKQGHRPEVFQPLLQRAVEDIRRIGEALADIVWNINPANDRPEQLMARMQRYAGEMLEGAGIKADLQFKQHNSDIRLPMEQRRDIYLVFKELVHNLVRHAHARHAVVKMSLANDRLHLFISDDGLGMDTTTIMRGNGLNNISQRLKKWGGTMSLQSTPDQGTEITIDCPIPA